MTAPAISSDLDLMAYNFNLETTDFLSQFRQTPDRTLVGQSFLHELAREGDVLSAEVIIAAGGEVDLADDEGRRPLHEAAFFGQKEMVSFLLSCGAVIDAPIHPFGHTALYYAVERGHIDVAKALIERGASRAVQDRLTGQGLLHLAAASGDLPMIGLLIAAGVDVFQEDKRGMTARDIAGRKGHKSVESVLLKVMEHHARYAMGV